MDKKGLGKGLGALLPGSLGEDATSVREVRLDRIRPNPYQPRREFDPDRLAELVESVKEHGILQPILLRRVAVDSYELIAGERRYRAAREAGLKKIPAIVKEYQNAQMLEVALIENVQREDINPVEAAMAYRQLMDEFGLTQQDVARRVGKAQPTVANTLRLLALPERVLESLGRGEITEGHARALLQVEGAAQMQAFETIRTKGMSVREAERLTRDIRVRGMGAARPAAPRAVAPAASVAEKDPNHAAVEEALQVALGTKVQIRRTGGVGRLEIEFYSDEELEGIVERIIGEGNA